MFFLLLGLINAQMQAQTEPDAGNWKTWFIPSGKSYRLAPPPSYKEELTQVIAAQKKVDSARLEEIMYWNAGAPGYRWQELMNKLWVVDTSYNGALAAMLLGVATYDATIAAWDTKYTFKRLRPFNADKRITPYGLKPESPSYPCEYSVAAGVAVSVFSKYYPHLTDSVKRMADRMMAARVASGFAFPSDIKAGFELGKTIGEKEIDETKDFVTKKIWDRKIPQQPGLYRGSYAMFPLAGLNKTVVLDSASQFRPPPPPDFAKDMAELKNFKQNFRSMANALYHASQFGWDDVLNKKIFEHNLHMNPPRAARIYAIKAIGAYDGFIACWDAKYAYWGIRPSQYDTTYKPLIGTPPFPGYPSGHAALSSVMSELFSYLFPADKASFQQRAKDVAESRFQAGIHFRTDNEVALDLGKKVAAAIIQRVKTDGADQDAVLARRRK